MQTLNHTPGWVRLVAFLLGRWLRRVPVSGETIDRLRALADEGRVVYLFRVSGWMEYLVWWSICRRARLPVPEIAYGIGRRTGPTDLRSIRIPTGTLVSLQDTQTADTDPVERLVREVRNKDADPGRIFLLPVALIWNLKPRSMERSLLEIVLGTKAMGGGLRKLLWLLAGPARTRVAVADEIRLHEYAREDPDAPELIARKVRLSVRYFLAREERGLLGPRLVPRRRLLERAMRDRRLQTTMREVAGAKGIPLADAETEVQKNLDEIAADYNWTAIRLLEWIVSRIFGRIYEDFQIDHDGLERVREAAKAGPVVLVPTHKSHMDYLILSYICKVNDLPPPHIAAGINLSFFPLGPIFRRCGAFFIRRSFLGDRLYETALRAYLRVLLREHYNLEFFIEGTRSRSGKILQPKFGMLSMVMEATEGLSDSRCHIVPVAIDYESLVEEASIVREAAGGEKRAESVGSLIKARSTLSRKYGSVYVRFESPVDIAELRAAAEAEGHAGLDMVRHAAYGVLDGMQRAVTVTATALVATAMCVHHKRGIRHERLLERVQLLADAMQRHGGRLSSEFIYGNLDPERSLRLLLRSRTVRLIELQGERVYTVDDDRRLALDYYKNNTVHFLVNTSFAALAFRLQREDSFESLWEGYSALHEIFLEEFHRIFTPPEPAELQAELDWFVERGFVKVVDGLYRVEEPTEIMAFENLTRNFLESAYIAVMTLLETSPQTAARESREWQRLTLEMGELLYARGDIWRSESRSKVNLQNALTSFRHAGLLVEAPEPPGRRRRQAYAVAADRVERLHWIRDTLKRILSEVQLN